MRCTSVLWSTLTTALLLACGSAPSSKSDGANSSGGQANKGGESGSQGGSATSDGGAGSDQTGGTSAGGTSTTVIEISEKMTLDSASARIGGRLGDDLIVDVEGTSDVGLLASVGVVIKDSSGKELPLFDSNWDGLLDSGSGRLVPVTPPTTKNVATQVVLKGMARIEDVASVDVALFDRDNRKTVSKTVDVHQQAVVSVLGQACDPMFVESRCRQGYNCTGASPVCVDGTAPTIELGGYYRGADGPFMRLRGEDPDGDVLIVRVDFLTKSNAPVYLDLDGDEQEDAASFDVQVGIQNRADGYVFINQAGLGFGEQVAKVGLTAVDSRSNTSATKVYSLDNTVVQTAGETCSVDGFDSCESGTLCIPDKLTGFAYCTREAQAKTSSCNLATVWNLGTDPHILTGTISGYSIWGDDSGCFSATAKGRPSSVIRMRLTSAAKKLTLTTAIPETQVDTGILVYSSCTATGTLLGCNDDSKGFSPEVTLKGLSAGDYIVIVKAVQSEGGSFGLKATVE